MDQGDLAMVGSVLAPSRPYLTRPYLTRSWLTPLRALLLTLGAVLCGLALSLLLGSSPAHAADNDGDGAGTGQLTLGSVTSAVVGTVTGTVDQTLPVVQHTVSVAGDTVTAAVAATSPIVTPVVSTVDATLTAVHQLISPAVPGVLALAQPAAASQTFPAPASAATALAGGSAHGSVPDSAIPLGSGTDPSPSSPILTSSSGTPFTALGALFALVALVLAAARRRLDDDALPASPAYETDTSPA